MLASPAIRWSLRVIILQGDALPKGAPPLGRKKLRVRLSVGHLGTRLLISYQDHACYPYQAETGPYFVPRSPHVAAYRWRTWAR